VEAAHDTGTLAGWACLELAQTFVRSGRAGEADAFLRESLCDRPRLLTLARSHLLRHAGRRAEARAMLQEAATWHPPLAAALAELGALAGALGDDVGSRRLVRRAEAACRRAGDAWGLAVVASHRGGAALRAFRLAEAEACFAAAADGKRACGERVGLATSLYYLGTIRRHLGDHGTARRLLEEALAISRAAGHHEGVVASLNGIAAAMTDAGDLERAAEVYRAALRALRGRGRPREEVAIRVNLGWTSRLRGDAQGMRRHYRAVLALPAEQAGLDHQAVARANLAASLLSAGRPAAALEMVLRVDDEARSRLSHHVRTGLAVEEARARLTLGDARSAAAVLRSVAPPGADAALPAGELAVAPLRARALLGRALGSGDDGRALLEDSARLVDALLAREPVPALRVGLLEGLREVDDARLDLALTSGPGCEARAWAVSQAARARELREELVSRRRRSPHGERKVAQVEAELRHLTGRTRLTRDEARRLRALRRRHADLVSWRRRRRLAARASGDVVTAEALTARLPADAALLEYHVSPRGVTTFVVHAGAVAATRLGLGEEVLSRTIRRLVEPLRQAGASADPRAILDAWDTSLAERLCSWLVEPALRRLPEAVTRLVIVPHGPLHALPFALLRRARRDAFLVEALTLSTIPTAALLRQSPARVPGRLERALSVSYSPPPGCRAQLETGPVALAPLPRARREAARVASAFPASTMLVGRDATVARTCRGLRSADVVHVAAHALVEGSGGGLASLVLAPGSPASGIDLLTEERIAATPTRARLVTLAACATAAGVVRHHEGTFGLARAFLRAGAESVLASLWPVDDGAAHRLTGLFYERLLAGDDRCLALARAQRAMMAGGRGHEHPFHWAAFGLVDRAPGR
jgi:CHAT domain-containing protein/tetratricopeptide (TPR) repeat protein